MKVTVEEFKQFTPGKKVVYKANHPRDLSNIRAVASYTQLNYPEIGVKFITHINRAKMEIEIEAISTKSKKR